MAMRVLAPTERDKPEPVPKAPKPDPCRNLRRQLCRKTANSTKVATKAATKASPRRASGAGPKPTVPQPLWPQLARMAKRVFWWGKPEDWLADAIRFAAQVMTYGDWTDTCTTLKLLGEPLFRQVLENAPPGVFDLKSWTYRHQYYH
jgi:hypothetical protein